MLLQRLKKAFGAVLTPRKWRALVTQVGLYSKNILVHHNFSLNLNSASYWNDQLAKLDDHWRDENYSHILPLLPRNDETFSLLDIGCAIGDGCEMIKRQFPNANICSTDISQVGISKARCRANGVDYSVLDILSDPLPGRYDYITIMETLEHFDKPFDVIDKCLRHVDRSLIVSVPYTSEYSGRVLVVGEHRYCFNEQTFAGYDHRVVEITEHGKDDQKEVVIIYEIWPPKSDRLASAPIRGKRPERRQTTSEADER